MKKILFAVGIAMLCTQAQADWWDSITDFFGGEEEIHEQATASSSENTTADMIQKGIALIPLLTQNLGVSDGQAKGGMGSILQAAKLLLSGTEYGTLLNSIPNASALLELAPALSQKGDSESAGLMDMAMKAASENSDSVKAGAQLLSQFKSLGLSADMIPKFTETAGQFLKQTDASEAASLLQKVTSL